MHIIPGQRLHEGVIREDADILREVGVVDADRAQAKHLCSCESAEACRPRCADDQLRETSPLEMIENLEHGRKAEALQFILGKLEFANGLEVFQWDPMVCNLRAAGHDCDIVAGRHTGCSHFADRGRDAVDILKRVGEPRPLFVFQKLWHLAGYRQSSLPHPIPLRQAECVDVGTEQGHDRRQGNDCLDAFKKLSPRNLLDEFRDETVADLVRDEICHQEGPALGFSDSGRVPCHGSLEFRLVQSLRKLFPEGHIARLCYFENFPCEDALGKKTKLVQE